MRSPAASKAPTDPTGRCFVSYRRSHSDEVALIIEAMLDHGVPPWQDRRNLQSTPLELELRQVLCSPELAGSLIWISEDFDKSPTILEIEAPQILARARSDPSFTAELWIADGMDYQGAGMVLRPIGRIDDIAASWHLEKANTSPHIVDGKSLRRIDAAEAVRIARRLLERRLAILHKTLPTGAPIRLLLNAHGDAGEAHRSGFPIQINWSRHFTHRFAPASTWERVLLPALQQVVDAVRAAAPGREIEAEGQASLVAGLALGRTFREVTGVHLGWRQQPANALWKLSEREVDPGVHLEPLRHLRIGSNDLAVLVSVTGDVEPAVSATEGLPTFRAIVKIRPRDGVARCEFSQPEHATYVAHLVARSIREARKELPAVERTHLFVAGPIGLAVLIGRQLNALVPIHTYEHDQVSAVGSYRPAVILTDPSSDR